MDYMFTNCSALEFVEASGWNQSSVTNMYGMFYECLKMATLDVTGWDTSNVTDVTCMFIRCRALKEMIGSGNLNFGKATNMGSMCEGWDSMTYLDATNWNCGSCTNMGQMFGWALKLLSHVTGLVDKAFGNLTYDMSLSEYPEDYRIAGLEDSIQETEGFF